MTPEHEEHPESPADDVVLVLKVLAGARAMLGSPSTAGVVAFGHFTNKDEAFASILRRGLALDEVQAS